MDCRQAQSRLADLSAEHLSSSSATELRAHLVQCPQCDQEWQVFQETLLILSVSTQPLPSQQQSRVMWDVCLQKVAEQVEQQRAERPALWGWARRQPRWGWAAVGSAIAVFGGVWWLAPHEETAPAQFAASPDIVQRISFERPPANASPLINHHVAMAFDPFTDHVGSTLISYSATVPSPTSTASSR